MQFAKFYGLGQGTWGNIAMNTWNQSVAWEDVFCSGKLVSEAPPRVSSLYCELSDVILVFGLMTSRGVLV